MTKIIIQWNRDECYVNGPELEQLYKFEDSSNSFVAKKQDGTVNDDSITLINEFIKKYSSLHKDIHNIFTVSEEYMSVMIDLSGGQELLLPEDSNNIFAKLFASNLDNKRGPGFGLEPFPQEFYQELFNIFKDVETNSFDDDGIDSDINGTLSGNFDGYYAFSAKLKPNGILWDTEHYSENDEDNDEDWQSNNSLQVRFFISEVSEFIVNIFSNFSSP